MSKFLSLLFSALVFAPTSACSEPDQKAAAENIECVDTGYTNLESISENRFIGHYGLDDWLTAASLPPEIENSIIRRAKECADIHQWSREAAKQATYYRVGVLLSAALNTNTPLNSEQMARLREAYSGADKARITRMMIPAIDAILAGQAPPAPSEADIGYLNQHITGRAGLPATKETKDYIGAWLLTKGMTEIPKSRFNTSSKL
ncbi:MAG: hypothetical protein IBJ13_06800 [Sphingopyxis sp.]|nr:hypothetical protein [Sphingopyxis sp.]